MEVIQGVTIGCKVPMMNDQVGTWLDGNGTSLIGQRRVVVLFAY